MRNIRTVIISSGLLFAVAGCTSSGNDFFASPWNDSASPDAPNSAQVDEQARAPRLALTVSHGAVLRNDSGMISQEKHMKSLRQAAEDGDSSAQFKLASAHRIGLAGAPDAEAAVDWYGQAAARGNASAQHHLGYMYAMGEGVARDLVTAYKWLNLAAVNLPPGWEHNQAVANREIVAREMRPAEIAEAHRLTREWMAAGAPAPARTAGDISVEVDFQELGFLDSLDLRTPI